MRPRVSAWDAPGDDRVMVVDERPFGWTTTLPYDDTGEIDPFAELARSIYQPITNRLEPLEPTYGYRIVYRSNAATPAFLTPSFLCLVAPLRVPLESEQLSTSKRTGFHSKANRI